jgi:RNA polymerase sigma-70 factor (ECF subfamily)
VADDADAEDILQDVFVKVQRGLGSLRSADKTEAWVYQIARNAITDHYRTRRPTEDLPRDLPQPEDATGEEGRAALLAAFRRMIDALPEPYREAVRLVELDGLTQRELAARLGISHSGAKSRVQRGRTLLKDMLLECCRIELDRRGGIVDCQPRNQGDCSECP